MHHFVYFSYFPSLDYKTFERKHYVSVIEILKFLYERELRWQTPHKNQEGEGLRLGICYLHIIHTILLRLRIFLVAWWVGTSGSHGKAPQLSQGSLCQLNIILFPISSTYTLADIFVIISNQ